ncbi:hypothetical protein COBT_003811, partial [Conglomerata obtusa]
MEERVKRIRKIQDEVRVKKKKIQEEKKLNCEKHERFEIGDAVLYRNRKKKSKFDPKWVGPLLVMAKRECGSYLLTDAERKSKIVAHRND